ncbi:PRC-barrel domain-containing protein [Sinomonas sp. P10A9]|uniref:PRC-barrel domain-containing protein n=1 Tax=Sinomonas puerhi TaxID=3238584 RepID=A0AB39L4F9_9MICC
MFTSADLEDLKDGQGDVVSQDGEKIGAIGEFYLDDHTDVPAWVTVKTGLFGTKESFVPLEGARIAEENLVVPYTKDHIKDAPRVDAEEHLEPGEEDRLYRHYGRSAPAQGLADTERAQNEAALQDGPIGRRQLAMGLRRRPLGNGLNQPVPVENTPVDGSAVETDRNIGDDRLR